MRWLVRVNSEWYKFEVQWSCLERQDKADDIPYDWWTIYNPSDSLHSFCSFPRDEQIAAVDDSLLKRIDFENSKFMLALILDMIYFQVTYKQ